MVVFTDALIASLKLLKKYWYFLPLTVLLDLFFFLLSGSGLSLFKQFAGPSISTLSETTGTLSKEIGAAVIEGQSALDVLFSNQQFSLSFNSLISIILMFAGLLYIFWVLFNGASWRLAHRMLGEKHKVMQFLLKFSFTTAIWFIGFLAILAALTRFILFALLRPAPLMTPALIESMSTGLNLVFFYFMFISMSIVAHTTTKQNFIRTFKYGVLEAPTFLATYFIIFLVMYVNFKITYVILNPLIIDNNLTSLNLIVTGIRFLLAAPFLTWARMYLIQVAKTVSKC